MPASSLSTPADRYTLFVQPGCSSCLRAKEYLAQHVGAYRLVDVAASSDGMQELRSLGMRHVPVLALGNACVMAQDIDDVAQFIGSPRADAQRMEPSALVARWDDVLDCATKFLPYLQDQLDEVPVAGRPGTVRDLALHVFQIPAAFLDVVNGVEPDWISNSMRPGRADMNTAALAERAARSRAALQAWWAVKGAIAPDETVTTLQGRQPLHWFLERSTWHSAQHTRQLEDLTLKRGAAVQGLLPPALLAGLPLPVRVWV